GFGGLPGERIIFAVIMPSARYALVTYVKDPVGEFVERLRKELHPELPHLAAHVTLLPPRNLHGTEKEAEEVLAEVCSEVEPFEVSMGEVETFIPATPTVFIRVGHEAYRMRELHDRLNRGALLNREEWNYMPHLTIAKMSTEEQAQHAYLVARRKWTRYEGSRCIQVRALTFVREEAANHWVDLAGLPLGRSLVSRLDG
ncbi:MAG TPA: 2'-5' RNA ligase family protein, partial [Terriglobales bacterium]|nr:2'-5' RNA ligase family protein [Terriglobales bacterium]